jgi:hypothetical protein
MPDTKYGFHFEPLEADVDQIVQRFLDNLKFNMGKDEFSATPFDCYYSIFTDRQGLPCRSLDCISAEPVCRRCQACLLSIPGVFDRTQLSNAC